MPFQCLQLIFSFLPPPAYAEQKQQAQGRDDANSFESIKESWRAEVIGETQGKQQQPTRLQDEDQDGDEEGEEAAAGKNTWSDI